MGQRLLWLLWLAGAVRPQEVSMMDVSRNKTSGRVTTLLHTSRHADEWIIQRRMHSKQAEINLLRAKMLNLQATINATRKQANNTAENTNVLLGGPAAAGYPSLQVVNNKSPQKKFNRNQETDFTRGPTSCNLHSADFNKFGAIANKFLCQAGHLVGGQNWSPEINLDSYNVEADYIYAIMLKGDEGNTDKNPFMEMRKPSEQRSEILEAAETDRQATIDQIEAEYAATMDKVANQPTLSEEAFAKEKAKADDVYNKAMQKIQKKLQRTREKADDKLNMVHWMLYDIPIQVTQLRGGLCNTYEGTGPRMLLDKSWGEGPAWVGQARNSWGKWHYTGPCPQSQQGFVGKYTFKAVIYRAPVGGIENGPGWEEVLGQVEQDKIAECSFTATATGRYHNYTWEDVQRTHADPYCKVNNMVDPVQLVCWGIPVTSMEVDSSEGRMRRYTPTSSWNVLDTAGAVVAQIPESNGHNVPNWRCTVSAKTEQMQCQGDAPYLWTARSYCLRPNWEKGSRPCRKRCNDGSEEYCDQNGCSCKHPFPFNFTTDETDVVIPLKSGIFQGPNKSIFGKNGGAIRVGPPFDNGRLSTEPTNPDMEMETKTLLRRAQQKAQAAADLAISHSYPIDREIRQPTKEQVEEAGPGPGKPWPGVGHLDSIVGDLQVED